MNDTIKTLIDAHEISNLSVKDLIIRICFLRDEPNEINFFYRLDTKGSNESMITNFVHRLQVWNNGHFNNGETIEERLNVILNGKEPNGNMSRLDIYKNAYGTEQDWSLPFHTYTSVDGTTIVDIIPDDGVYIYDKDGEIINFVIDELHNEPEWFTAVADFVLCATLQGGRALRDKLELK